MNFIQNVVLIFMLWIAIYSLISRVCTCIERRSLAKYMGKTDEGKKVVENRFGKGLTDDDLK